MKVKDGKWSISSRDLFRGSKCDHCTRVSMVVAAGVDEAIDRLRLYLEDLSTKLPIIQGNQREHMVFDQIEASLPEGDFLLLDDFSESSTLAAMEQGVPVIAQAFIARNLSGIQWSGVADLLVRDGYDITQTESNEIVATPTPGENGGGYRALDVKNSGSMSDSYVVQLGSYQAALQELGHLGSGNPAIIFGFGKGIEEIDSMQSIEAFSQAVSETRPLLDETDPLECTLDLVVTWSCSQPKVCKEVYCEYPKLCKELFEATGDISLLHQKSYHHINWLRDSGYETVRNLALSADKPSLAKGDEDLANYYFHAAKAMQMEKDGKRTIAGLIQGKVDLPPRNQGDLFFDIEWFNPVDRVDPLFFMLGVMDSDEKFFDFTSAAETEERGRFEGFVTYATERLDAYPEMHIYHVNSPEVTKLRDLSKKHGGYLTDEVELLVSRMVDLQKIAKATFVPGSGSYSIKSLERYYPDRDRLRGNSDVSAGDDAMYKFHLFLEASADGRGSEATQIMDSIREYNKDDCLSTKLLYEWMATMEFIEPWELHHPQ